ncbi:helix-turn-helix transcriptional regulator [Parasynechococcus marenigrum]|nr:AlpA family phage regulatory protein [Parasynechococcus marenigrum]
MRQSRLIRLSEVKEMTGLSRSTIYSHMSQGLFPKQSKVGTRIAVWLESDILSWIEQTTKQ